MTPSTGTPARPSSHVSSPITGLPAFSARAISLSVPHAPPIATSASAARTISALRASPSPVGIASSTQPLASSRSVPGSSPTVVPPRERAPRQAASMTPPRPPHTRTAPASAIAAPASSAHAASRASARPGPTTAIHGAGRGIALVVAPVRGHSLADDEVDQLARHDHDLHDVAAVDVLLDL